MVAFTPFWTSKSMLVLHSFFSSFPICVDLKNVHSICIQIIFLNALSPKIHTHGDVYVFCGGFFMYIWNKNETTLLNLKKREIWLITLSGSMYKFTKCGLIWFALKCRPNKTLTHPYLGEVTIERNDSYLWVKISEIVLQISQSHASLTMTTFLT